jgi:hypothetical protein
MGSITGMKSGIQSCTPEMPTKASATQVHTGDEQQDTGMFAV